MKKAPNVKILAAVTAAVFVAGVGASFYQYSSMSEVANRVEALRKKAAHEKELAQQADSTALKLKEAQDRLDHLEKGVPKPAYVPTLLKELEAVGTSNGISVLGVRPLQTTDKAKKDDSKKDNKPYDELRIEVKGRGTYRAVMNFLEALKKFPKIVAARSVTASPKVEIGKASTGRLDVTIELKTYLFAESGDAPSGDKDSKPSPEVTVKNG